MSDARSLSSVRLVGGVVLAQTCGMLGSATFASTLTELARLWHLDSTHAVHIFLATRLPYHCWWHSPTASIRARYIWQDA